MAQTDASKHGRTAELGRYILNGLAATVVHYAVLSFNIHVLEIRYAGLANFIAAWFGLTASFFGARHFVFRAQQGPISPQALRFFALNMFFALIHGLILFLWTDQLGLSYTVGFLIATVIQTVVSYVANRQFVFARK